MKTNEILKDATWGAEIHQGLAPRTTDVVITKTRVSSFNASPLDRDDSRSPSGSFTTT